MTIDPALVSAILGPAGALALAVVVLLVLAKVIQILWRDHLAADRDDRDQRDRAMALAESMAASNKGMVAAWEARNRADALRRRKADTP